MPHLLAAAFALTLAGSAHTGPAGASLDPPSPCTAMALATLAAAPRAASPDGSATPSQDTIPADTYADSSVVVTLERFKAANPSDLRGLASYEARAWERLRVGLGGSWLRRDRELWIQERAARVRWEADGTRIVRWESARQASPAAGMYSARDTSMARALADDLAQLVEGDSPVFHRPGDAYIPIGAGGRALHPLADTALHHYRYRSGDTIRVTLPPDAHRITLVEVRAEPRRADFRLVAATLWFDEGTGDLVRAAYRPARPFRLGLDADDDVPRVLRAVEAEVEQITVDYGLYHLRWWLPYRFSLSLEVRAGRLVRIPVVHEWEMTGYTVNEAASPDLDPVTLPAGWSRTVHTVESAEGSADSTTTIVLVPPSDSLHRSSAVVGGPDGAGAESGFDDAELHRLRAELDRVLPRATIHGPRLLWGIADGMVRYNRVEGLSVGVAAEAPVPVGPRGLAGRAELRMGTADRSPMGELGLRWGPAETQHGATVYHRLEHTSDWEDPFGLSASLASLVSGNDRGEYFRATGAEVWTARRGERGSLRGRFFAERHGRVDRSTHFHLTRIFDDDSLRSNLAADEQDRIGIAAGLKGHLGMDPEALRLFGSLLSESAIGEPGAYLRVGASGGFAVPLGPVQLGLEAGAGAGWGPLPVQRRFFLGGPATVRGVRSSSLQGESFWFGRLEMSRGEPAGRITVFGDLGWAGPKDAWGSGTPIRSVGAGISLLDGLVRMDLARNLDASAWRLHAYLDGIL